MGMNVADFETRDREPSETLSQIFLKTKLCSSFTHPTSLPKLAAAELIPPLDDFFSNGVKSLQGYPPNYQSPTV
jgi:hypothetical protein